MSLNLEHRIRGRNETPNTVKKIGKRQQRASCAYSAHSTAFCNSDILRGDFPEWEAFDHAG